MPRGSRSGGISRSRASPPPAAARPAPPPVQPQPQTVMVVPAGRQPGLFAQMASTAAGVAVGSAVGHTIGAAMTGGLGGSGSHPPAQAQEAPVAPMQAAPQQTSFMNQDRMRNACAFELEQFLQCTQTQRDITLCSGFNESLRECKTRNGLQG